MAGECATVDCRVLEEEVGAIQQRNKMLNLIPSCLVLSTYTGFRPVAFIPGITGDEAQIPSQDC